MTTHQVSPHRPYDYVQCCIDVTSINLPLVSYFCHVVYLTTEINNQPATAHRRYNTNWTNTMIACLILAEASCWMPTKHHWEYHIQNRIHLTHDCRILDLPAYVQRASALICDRIHVDSSYLCSWGFCWAHIYSLDSKQIAPNWLWLSRFNRECIHTLEHIKAGQQTYLHFSWLSPQCVCISGSNMSSAEVVQDWGMPFYLKKAYDTS